MLQDIAPHVFNNQYLDKKPSQQDYIFIIKESNILLEKKGEEIEFPKFKDLSETYVELESNSVFLFSIDNVNYFLSLNVEIEEGNRWKYENIHLLRSAKPMWKVFAAAVGGQLQLWYERNKFCGRCGAKLMKHDAERALICPNCSNTVYPTLSPSVIVAITNGDKLLMTKYAHGIYKKYALVAGYAEIGESLEETVKREVMEEVGLKVKNITYYKTQPWPFSGALLVGYFAEVDGDDMVTLQEEELSEAAWFKREEIPNNPTKISLTNEMIELFRNRENKNIK